MRVFRKGVTRAVYCSSRRRAIGFDCMPVTDALLRKIWNKSEDASLQPVSLASTSPNQYFNLCIIGKVTCVLSPVVVRGTYCEMLKHALAPDVP